MERALYALRDAGRSDLLGLLAERKVRLPELHDAYLVGKDQLEHLKAAAEGPRLGHLVDDWMEWMGSPAGISPRTRRRYTKRTIQRYATSWEGFFSVLPRGRESQISDLTRGFVLDYRRARSRAVGGKSRRTVKGRPLSPATLNRDMAALGAFLTWARDVGGHRVEVPKFRRELETRGRERWLSSDELLAFERACSPSWWPFFATLFYTGARLGEVQGLRGADILLHARRITIHEESQRVKSSESVRDLPTPPALERALAGHLANVGPGPADLVFPGRFQDYGKVRRAWNAACQGSGIEGATPHDARHSFAVHAAQAGVPIVRLQKLLGHATATMTLRYMKHAPEAYLDEDAASIARHMGGEGDEEIAARVEGARRALKKA
jgi:integrase